MRLIYAMLLFAVFGCNNKEEKKEAMNMPGAYNMLSQTLNDGKKDREYHNTQLKIYTGDFMMYAHINSPDSLSGFGIAAYSADTGIITEHTVFHASPAAADSTPATYGLHIETTSKGFKQVIPELQDEGRKIKLTEEYEAVGDTMKTALDGAWKLTASYSIKGTDTAWDKITQYKTYYAGHFIFGHTFTDSAGKYHSGIGFGTFMMNGPNKVKESITVSTYYEIRGKTVDIDIEMNGADEFKQTITNPGGTKNIELYRRLKK